jgi:molybdopterin-guanine dinucleotide biosynthesis protein A
MTGATVGAVLAGGLGRRIGGDKGMVELDGRPLLGYPVAALRAVLEQVVIVARPETLLPAEVTRETAVWTEPDGQARHPACGIAHALRCAPGRAVVVVACDMPLLSGELLRALAFTDADGAPALVPRAAGVLQPLCARYEQAALAPLEHFEDGARMTDLAEALGPAILEWPEERPFLSVNAPEDVLTASAALAAARAQPNVNA